MIAVPFVAFTFASLLTVVPVIVSFAIGTGKQLESPSAVVVDQTGMSPAVPEPVMVPPLPAGVAHVPSPLQKVVAPALEPLFRFVTGRFPETSAVRLTALNVGAPLALPWSTWAVVPSEPRVAGVVAAPPPRTIWFAASRPLDAMEATPLK
jgi:hypothetical protein